MSNRNRTAGHNYERETVKLLNPQFPNIVTARAESRNMDNKGVDIFGDSLPVHIQCKLSQNQPNFYTLLYNDNLPTDKDTVVFWKKVEKAKTRFVSKEQIVSMKLETFLKLINSFKI